MSPPATGVNPPKGLIPTRSPGRLARSVGAAAGHQRSTPVTHDGSFRGACGSREPSALPHRKAPLERVSRILARALVKVRGDAWWVVSDKRRRPRPGQTAGHARFPVMPSASAPLRNPVGPITRACAFVYSERLSGASRGCVTSRQLPTRSNPGVPGSASRLEGHERHCADPGQPGRAARHSLEPHGPERRPTGPSSPCASPSPARRPGSSAGPSAPACPPWPATGATPWSPPCATPMAIEWPKLTRGNASDSS